MEKPIEVALYHDAEVFFDALPQPIRKKFGQAFRKTENRFVGDWFVKMPDTDDLWEFRADGPNHTYRLYAFWDKTGPTETIIVCTHGLDKKTQKTPAREIEKAQRIRQAYFKGGS